MSQQQLSAAEAAMVATWEQHLGAEFGMKSAPAALETMSAHPFVILVRWPPEAQAETAS